MKEMYFVNPINKKVGRYYSDQVNDYIKQIIEKYGKGICLVICTSKHSFVDETLIQTLNIFDTFVMQELNVAMVDHIFEQYKWGYTYDCQTFEAHFFFENEFDAVYFELLT